MQVFFILTLPVVLAFLSILIKKPRAAGLINAAGYFIILLFSLSIFKRILFLKLAFSFYNFFYLDALGAFFLLLTSTLAFAVSLFSIAYLKKDLSLGRITEKKAGLYYFLFNLFCFSMLFVPTVNNLGILWVGIEVTTLVSAFLVGFYNTKESVEAAWKYIIICSVGIIFALLGTILFSYAFSVTGLAKSLNWTDINQVAHILNKDIIKIAFIFILVGYGTKAGICPMHTWLPDAHSQALTPISALLSGVLIKTALYAILRFGIIAAKCLGFAFFGKLMIFFGLFSLIISSAFILVQKDLKRLLAYSSVEHVGIISIGFGLGSPLAVCGALLHIFFHAVTKSLMFFAAGDMVNAYNKHNMNSIRGVAKALPFTGFMALIGIFALCGFAPFSLFVSEMFIITAAFAKSSFFTGGALLGLLCVIFAAFINHFGKMLFGNPPKDLPVSGQPLSAKFAFLFLFLLVLLAGVAGIFLKKDFIWIAQILLKP